MPAKGYQYYEVNSYPDWNDGYVFRTTHQETISGDFDIAPQTVITAVGLADLPVFKKYHVLHETYQKVRGRYKNEPITGYIAQVEFHIYYHTEQKRLLIDTPRNICKEMVDRLEKSDIDFLVIPHKIDLSKLGIDLSDRVRGGWLGVSVEDQPTADNRITWLLNTPAAVRGVSVEPMLGEVNLDKHEFLCETWSKGGITIGTYLDWVIAGCESGPGARPMDLDWARRLRDQCQAAGVPFFLKQAKIDGKLVKMPQLDGKIWDELPNG
jgi:hypothetical protein